MGNDVIPLEVRQQMTGNVVDNQFGDILVVGGGVSGIQASLDFAAAGCMVCRVG